MQDLYVITSLENRLSALVADFDGDCRAIAQECAEEGYPAYGSTYDLRVDTLWERSYRDTYEYLRERLEEEKESHLFTALPDVVGWCKWHQSVNSLNPDPVQTGTDPDGFPVWEYPEW